VYGGSSVWGPGSQTPLLRWADGTSSGISVRIATALDGALSIEWMPWGAELTQSEPQSTVIDEGGIVTSTRNDQCGNVLRFGTWKTTTSDTFTVVTTGFGGAGTQINWAVEDKPVAPGVTTLAVDLGASTFHLGCALSADGRSLALTSAPGDVLHLGVGAQITDPVGRSAHLKAFFSVESGYYTGMHPDDIRRAAQCIAVNIPVPVEIGDFIIPLEWPGWKVEQWKRRAIERLEVEPDIGEAGRHALTTLVELQVASSQFTAAARGLLQP
jgi:hypothetical protein